MTAEGNEEAVLTQQENFENETSESENFEIDTMQTESSPLMKKVYTEYTAKGKQCSREENEELYKNAEMLLKMRTSLNFELLSSPTAILNFEQEIEVDNHIYYLLDNEEITGWDYYEKRAEEIYDREYVDNNFIPKYMEELEGLFIELDNHLWRAHTDAPCNGVDIESIKISQQGKNSYSIIGITEYDSGPMLILFNVRVNEEKTCGLEIVSEVEIDAATDMEAW